MNRCYSRVLNWRLILQRPFLIDELDVNSRDAVGADVLGANGGVERDSALLACQRNEAALVES